ncbi:MAG: hypothetical protein P4N24_17650 [Acidobacteriota bacterium]|nr:hypothetical protein [Acidobacteriota bacterium]
MLGNQGLTAAKFDTNIRALRGTVMGLPVSNLSTESDFYVGLPSGFNVVPTGVLSQDVVEPGYPLTSELWLDPNTSNPINGSTPPSPFVSQGRAWGLVVSAAEAEVIAADTTIQAEDDVVIADATGRVTSVRNVTTGNTAYVVGKAKYPATAVNQRIRIQVSLRQEKV